MFKMSSCTDLYSMVGRDVAEAQPQTTRVFACVAEHGWRTPRRVSSDGGAPLLGRGEPLIGALLETDLFARTLSFMCCTEWLATK